MKENVPLIVLPLDKKVAIKEVNTTDECVSIIFENDYRIIFRTEHNPDCCEYVYGDFQIFKESNLVGRTFKNIEIKGIPDMGILFCFNNSSSHFEKLAVFCYNEQNGYYSSNLDLEIIEQDPHVQEKMHKHTVINVSAYVEDRIC